MRKRWVLLVLSLLSLYSVIGVRCWGNLAAEDRKESCAILLDNAKTARNSGDFDRAAALLREAQRISNQTGRSDLEAVSLLNLGIALWDLGEMPEAARKFGEAVPLFEKAGDVQNKEICVKGQEIARNYALGKDSRSGNRLRESLGYFDKAIALGRTTGIDDFELKCVRQKSLTYWQLNDFDSFYLCNQRGLEIAKKINHRKEVGRCLNNIGAYYIKNSDFTQALRISRTALPIIQLDHDLNEEAICRSNIGIIYRNLGELNLAVKEKSHALQLVEQLGDPRAISEYRGDLGAVLLRRGFVDRNLQDVRNALIELNLCLGVKQIDAPASVRIAMLSNAGYAYFLLQFYNRAIELFNEALELTEFGVFPEEYGHIINNIGNSYLNKGDFNRALDYFTRADELSKRTNFMEVLWEADYGLGRCHDAQGDLVHALCFYKKSIEALERVRKRISSDMFKISFARNKMDVYERALDILYSLYKMAPLNAPLEEIYKMMERAKAQAFLESVGDASRQLFNEIDLETEASERTLSREIAALTKGVTSAKPNKASRAERPCNPESKKEEQIKVMSNLKNEMRPAERLSSANGLTLADAQTHLLDEKSAILEYFVGSNRSYLLMITRHEAELCVLPGRSKLEDSLRGYLKCLSSPSDGKFEGMQAAERIAGELLVPLNDGNHPGIETLIVVPDGILHYLPFETLRLPGSQGPRFLLEKYQISYAPSVSALAFLKDRPRTSRPSKDFLAFGAPAHPELGHSKDIGDGFGQDVWREFYMDRGDVLTPLPFSKVEILKAAGIFLPRKEDIYLGDQASELVLKRLALEEYRIVHFACHGIFDDKIPFRSSLVLSPDGRQGEDGFLQLREIYNLKMDAELVVLSACQSANGSLELGEGLVGLTRGFFQAGARSIVSSLWAINDRSTATFMEDFYAALARGEDKGSALRSAKLRVLNSPRSHPFYWAAFILSGNPSPIRLEGRQKGMPN